MNVSLLLTYATACVYPHIHRVGDVDLRERLRSVQLRALPDMERLARKLERKKTTLQDLCRLYQASAQLPHLADALAEHGSSAAPLLQRLYVTPLRTAHDGEHLGKFESLLESAVDLDRIPDDYLIAATFDPELKTLQATKDQIQVELEKVREACWPWPMCVRCNAPSSRTLHCTPHRPCELNAHLASSSTRSVQSLLHPLSH